MKRLSKGIWFALLGLLVCGPYTPLVSPARNEATLIGLPVEIVIWGAWTLATCSAVSWFAVSAWAKDEV